MLKEIYMHGISVNRGFGREMIKCRTKCIKMCGDRENPKARGSEKKGRWYLSNLDIINLLRRAAIPDTDFLRFIDRQWIVQ